MISTPDQRIWNPAFTRVFYASAFQGMSFTLLIHIPGYFSALGGSEGQIGLVYSVAAVVAITVRPAVGRLLDLKGRKPVLVVVALIDVFAILLYLALSSFGIEVYGVRIVQGTTEVLLFTGYLAYAADALPAQNRTQGMAYFGLSGLVPISLGPLVGDLLLRSWSYTAVFLTSAAFGLAGWLVVLSMPRLEIDQRAVPRRSFVAAVRQREIVPLWVLVFAFASVMAVIFTFMATFVEQTRVGSVGLFFVVYGGVAVAVRIVAAKLPDRYGYRRVVIPAFVGMVLMLVLLAASGSQVGFVVAAALGGAGHGVVFPILSAEAVNRTRINERGSALAFFTALFDGATLIVAPVVGTVIDQVDYSSAFTLTAALGATALVTFTVWDRKVLPAGGLRVAESAP